MTREELLHNLLNGAGQLQADLDAAADQLNGYLAQETTYKLTLQEIQETKDVMEAEILLSEMAPEGKINGKNEAARKMQVTIFLDELTGSDDAYGKVVSELQHTAKQLEYIKLNIAQAINRYSALRNQARLVSAALTALGS